MAAGLRRHYGRVRHVVQARAIGEAGELVVIGPVFHLALGTEQLFIGFFALRHVGGDPEIPGDGVVAAVVQGRHRQKNR